MRLIVNIPLNNPNQRGNFWKRARVKPKRLARRVFVLSVLRDIPLLGILINIGNVKEFQPIYNDFISFATEHYKKYIHDMKEIMKEIRGKF